MHLHEMRDSDNHFVIDPETMVITNKSTKHTLQQGDHNSEIYTFELPKMIEGHDMTKCNLVQIHYINIKGDKTGQIKDVHKVADIAVSEDEPGTLVFTWTVHGNATKYAGSLNFRIHFYCTDTDGKYTYKKHTEIFKGITISEGFDNAEAVEKDHSDILSQWESRLNALENSGGDSAVLHIPQTLTEEQKAQARENIGAIANDRATATGENLLIIDDISSVSHSVNVRLSSETITDFSEVGITCSGKNLFDISQWTGGNAHSSFAVSQNEDGDIVVVNNTASQRAVDFIVNIPTGVETITASHSNEGFNLFFLTYKNGAWSGAAPYTFDMPRVFDCNTYEHNQILIRLFAPVGTSIIKGAQVEIGAVRTEYEVSTVSHYTANTAGEVKAQSVFPTMMIFPDADGINLEAEYKIDVGSSGISEKQVAEIIAKAKGEIQETVKPKSKVAGKRMAVIGDSISAGVSSVTLDSGVITPTSGTNLLTAKGKAWWQLVQNRYGIVNVVNNSVAGASFSRDGSVGNPRFTTYLNETDIAPDTDIIMVYGGTNDWGVNVPLGALSDKASTENTATFCASVKAVIEYLTTNFPEKEIVFITPLQRWFRSTKIDENTGEIVPSGIDYDMDIAGDENFFFNCRNGLGLYLRDYADKLKQLCADYGVAVCDLYTNSQMYMNNEAFKEKYAPDGLHPNEVGTERYVKNGIFPVLDRLWQYREIDSQEE